MSEVRRCSNLQVWEALQYGGSANGWVRWDDYASLKAEADRLKSEVERLSKAGDAMAEAMWYGDAERSIWVKKFAETEWNAAKEAKPNE